MKLTEPQRAELTVQFATFKLISKYFLGVSNSAYPIMHSTLRAVSIRLTIFTCMNVSGAVRVGVHGAADRVRMCL